MSEDKIKNKKSYKSNFDNIYQDDFLTNGFDFSVDILQFSSAETSKNNSPKEIIINADKQPVASLLAMNIQQINNHLFKDKDEQEVNSTMSKLIEKNESADDDFSPGM